MTLTQKILAHHAIGLKRPWVETGDILSIRVDWTIASELAWNGMEKTYESLGRPPLFNRERFFLAVDHTVDPETMASDARTQKLVQLSRNFAKERKIKHFYDANETILHTKFYRDLVQPGQVVLGADSHSSSHGGMGAFSIGLGGADITAAMVLGQSWIEVPEAILVDYVGAPPFGMGGKDVILKTLGDLGRNTVAMERSVEYRGAAVRTFSTDMRFTIANMTAEFGGLNGIFEADEIVAEWLAGRRDENRDALYFRADDDAPYSARYKIDLSALEPLIAKPYSPDNVTTAALAAGQALDGVFIGACTTTEEELVLGALVLEAALAEGREIVQRPGKKLVIPGDLTIQNRLAERGLWAIYERAGFRVGVPGCSMCLGVASDRALPGEHWLSSQNRNFPNRMGQGSHAYLASGATVAASAISMAITDPRALLAKVDQARFAKLLAREQGGLGTNVVTTVEPTIAAASDSNDQTSAGTPSIVPANENSAKSLLLSSRIQRFGDHIDTDAIIPGQFCHLTKLEELGEKCFHFVQPDFVARVRSGAAVVVAGEGWGSGSSREQAVWALIGAGVKAVIAKSFAFIHKRNLVNDALPYLVILEPRFYELAADGAEVTINQQTGAVTVAGESFISHGATPMIQALREAGGLVPAIRQYGANVFETLARA